MSVCLTLFESTDARDLGLITLFLFLLLFLFIISVVGLSIWECAAHLLKPYCQSPSQLFHLCARLPITLFETISCSFFFRVVLWWCKLCFVFIALLPSDYYHVSFSNVRQWTSKPVVSVGRFVGLLVCLMVTQPFDDPTGTPIGLIVLIFFYPFSSFLL